MPNDPQKTLSTGTHGEYAVAAYLQRLGFTIVGRNIAKKSGELDVVATKDGVMHIVEVKTAICADFPNDDGALQDIYDPSQNLHALKIAKVVRTAEWHVAEIGWKGEWQIDAALVWLRRSDKVARIRYYPQIL